MLFCPTEWDTMQSKATHLHREYDEESLVYYDSW